jgi:predicted nuclease of predicted toxin-antitoxin system
MTVWPDAQLSPAIAPWISVQFSVAAVAVRDLGLRDSTDREIFLKARQAAAIVMTKDSDLVRLQQELGPPPQLIWLTFGNTSNTHLSQILTRSLGKSLEFIQAGESLVEISARHAQTT